MRPIILIITFFISLPAVSQEMSFEKGKINYNGEFISLKTAKYLSKEYSPKAYQEFNISQQSQFMLNSYAIGTGAFLYFWGVTEDALGPKILGPIVTASGLSYLQFIKRKRIRKGVRYYNNSVRNKAIELANKKAESEKKRRAR